jgi:hypothetical protein
MIIAFMAAVILVYLVYVGIKDKDNKSDKSKSNIGNLSNLNVGNVGSNVGKGVDKKSENINNRIEKAFINYTKDISKYNIGAKSYEYDFIDNEQPLNGLSPNFKQNYPSTLKKSNKMFVVPDLSIKYDNLLNTRNNSIKNYIY